MKFTVVLTPAAEQHLAAAWLASSDRPAVTAAAHQIEQKPPATRSTPGSPGRRA